MAAILLPGLISIVYFFRDCTWDGSPFDLIGFIFGYTAAWNSPPPPEGYAVFGSKRDP